MQVVTLLSALSFSIPSKSKESPSLSSLLYSFPVYLGSNYYTEACADLP